MRKMTLKQSLELCAKYWGILAETGCAKYDIPGMRQLVHGCPCCQYAAEQNNAVHLSDCSLCPMMGYWMRFRRRTGGRPTKAAYIDFACERNDTPYSKWWDLIGDPRAKARAMTKRYARQISNAALRELKKLEAK